MNFLQENAAAFFIELSAEDKAFLEDAFGKDKVELPYSRNVHCIQLCGLLELAILHALQCSAVALYSSAGSSTFTRHEGAWRDTCAGRWREVQCRGC